MGVETAVKEVVNVLSLSWVLAFIPVILLLIGGMMGLAAFRNRQYEKSKEARNKREFAEFLHRTID
jgi:hypothetical protein